MREVKENPYNVKSVVCDYGVYFKDKLVEGLILNSSQNARLVCDILNADYNHKVYKED